jgi:cell division protein FtsQ
VPSADADGRRHSREIRALTCPHLPAGLHLEPSGHAILTIGRQGSTLALGLPPYARKLAMAAEVMGELRAKNRVPGIVFLDNDAHPERVVVRMK